MLALSRTQTYKSGLRRSNHILIIGMILSIIAVTVILVGSLSSALPAKPIAFDYNYEPVVIQKGDTLWSLAAQHNSGGDINQLVHKTMKYNNLANAFIEPGQIIYIAVRV